MQTAEMLDNGVAIEDAQFGEGRQADVRAAGPDDFCFCICMCYDAPTRTSSYSSTNVTVTATAPQ
jgi:hypothetical protein